MLIKLNDKIIYNPVLNALEVPNSAEALMIANLIITQCIITSGSETDEFVVPEEEKRNSMHPVWPGRRKNMHANN